MDIRRRQCWRGWVVFENSLMPDFRWKPHSKNINHCVFSDHNCDILDCPHFKQTGIWNQSNSSNRSDETFGTQDYKKIEWKKSQSSHPKAFFVASSFHDDCMLLRNRFHSLIASSVQWQGRNNSGWISVVSSRGWIAVHRAHILDGTVRKRYAHAKRYDIVLWHDTSHTLNPMITP